ncbi:MAG: SGNH/GDSL hydrolase family protein [Bacteroidia bacterium]
MARLIKINLLILIALLLLVELTGQILYRVKWGHFMFSDPLQQLHQTVYRRHPFLSVALNKNVKAVYDETPNHDNHLVTTTELGTRWTGADLYDTTKIRIACIGGSTTFCIGVNDKNSWPALLQKKLGSNYAVFNYGLSGYTTVEAIIQMALFIPEIKPRLIIFYEGWNDLHVYHTENTYPDYFSHGVAQLNEVLAVHLEDSTCLGKLRRMSGLFYIADNIHERIFKQKETVRYSVPDENINKLFERNIHTLITLSSGLKSKPVFISQVLNPFTKRHSGFSHQWTMHIEDNKVPVFMNQMNRIVENICAADSNCVYFDFKNSITWQEKYFLDDGHFTIEGNEIFSDALTQKIKTIKF